MTKPGKGWRGVAVGATARLPPERKANARLDGFRLGGLIQLPSAGRERLRPVWIVAANEALCQGDRQVRCSHASA